MKYNVKGSSYKHRKWQLSAQEMGLIRIVADKDKGVCVYKAKSPSQAQTFKLRLRTYLHDKDDYRILICSVMPHRQEVLILWNSVKFKSKKITDEVREAAKRAFVFDVEKNEGMDAELYDVAVGKMFPQDEEMSDLIEERVKALKEDAKNGQK